ncbi:LysM peptidoglycan-binding domain-containing protein [Streptomyces sp. NRRL S-813]|uniref:LysM peptidoglycan-binding domain-containing protein n=1 Tax=Streptomyces sp. NRRL S-813 TaxID=1463919 RepID=UPI001F1E821B|nr:LysM peptidoglycan-binding domain-containing protein [Streptomyces sp. NRRL S-813]
MRSSGISVHRPASAARSRRRGRHVRSALRASAAAAASVAVVLGTTNVPAASAASVSAVPGTLHGTVTGASKPLPGARVTLFAGSRTGVRELGHATTDATGSFAISYAPPAAGVLYVEATPADDHRLLLRSVVAVGEGGAVPARTVSRVRVNELTTVAATYALAQFSGPRGVDGPGPGLQNAAATAFNLADPVTGGPGEVVTNADNGTTNETLATLDTLANLVSLCVSDTVRCDRMLRLATPVGGTAPRDTVQAVLNLVRNPTLSPAGLHDLARTASHYTPALAAPPTAWILALRYTDTDLYSPGRIAFDAKGNAWTSNNWLPGTQNPTPYISVLDPTGRPILGSPIPGGGMKGGDWGAAVAPDGSVWMSSYGGNSVAHYSATGRPLSPPAGWKNGGLIHPQGIAVDQRGNVWIANNYGLETAPGLGNVVVYPHGDPSKAITITGGGLNHPFAVQIDGFGRAWVTNAGLGGAQLVNTRLAPLIGKFGGSVTVIGPDFRPTASSPIESSSFKWPLGIAIDSRNNAWTNSYLSSEITELRPDGTVAGVHKLPERTFPWSVAVDGSDRVWVAGFLTPGVWTLCGADTAACPPGSTTGTILSPPQGYQNKAIQHLTAVQIDQSGNVWLANNWSHIVPPAGGTGLVELIGLATPVCTPLTPVPARPSSATATACPSRTAATTPPTGKQAGSGTGTDPYTVRPGDTLATIGRAHGESWQALYEKNRTAVGRDPNLITPGLGLTLH